MSNQKTIKVVQISFNNGEMHAIDDQGRLWRTENLSTWKLIQLPNEPAKFDDSNIRSTLDIGVKNAE